MFNTKRVFIKASGKVKEKQLFNLLCSLLRFECIYDGCFFALEKITFDDVNRTDEFKDKMLSFYSGSHRYFQIRQPMDDKIYKKGFCAWERYDRKNNYLIQMFFYSSFTNGITADLRIALFSEIFEPLSKVLEEESGLVVENSNPFLVKKNRCPKCNNKWESMSGREPNFNDRITSVITCFGETIFEGDDIKKIVKKLVNTRNKILHLDKDKKEFLTGKQCGFYMKKLVLLFQLIVLEECGVFDSEVWLYTVEELKKYNFQFSRCRIK